MTPFLSLSLPSLSLSVPACVFCIIIFASHVLLPCHLLSVSGHSVVSASQTFFRALFSQSLPLLDLISVLSSPLCDSLSFSTFSVLRYSEHVIRSLFFPLYDFFSAYDSLSVLSSVYSYICSLIAVLSSLCYRLNALRSVPSYPLYVFFSAFSSTSSFSYAFLFMLPSTEYKCSRLCASTSVVQKLLVI